MILQFAAAAVGTVAFALLFGIPKQYYLLCGLIGGGGWLLYSWLHGVGCSTTEAVFWATVLVIVLSRFCAVWRRCPVTVFLIAGIFPLVPGAGIYWTAYYLVTEQTGLALSNGLAALKSALAIVLGIIFVLAIPGKFFCVFSRHKPSEKI